MDIGDINNDGVDDLAVAAPSLGLSSNQNFTGGVYILLMKADNTLKSDPVRITHSDDPAGIQLPAGSHFGTSVANIGDFDGDGRNELAIGTLNGKIYIVHLTSNGELASFSTIDFNAINSISEGINLVHADRFGISIANLGDIDGDGVIDLAVGAHRDDDKGSVYILFMDDETSAPTLKDVVKLDTTDANLANDDQFGISVANIGDLNQDGINDLAVGAIGDDGAADNAGTVHIFHLDRDGSVKPGGFEIFDSAFNPDPENDTGRSIANLGDLNGDGINDIAVGATGADSSLSNDAGAVFIIFMGRTKDQITTNSFFRIDTNSHPDLNLSVSDRFGEAIANIGDRNGDGINDLAVGAPRTDDNKPNAGGSDSGAFYIMYMDAETVVTNVTAEEENRRYDINDTINIQVIFSEVVDVSGTPRLILDLEGTDRTVDYTAGSGSDTLTFRYTVASTDRATDLDYKSTASLTLNGGTINATAAPKYRALLILPEPGTRGSLSSNKNISIRRQEITNTPPRPIIESIPTQELTGNTSFTYPILFIDDENDPLTYALLSDPDPPDWLSLDSDEATFSGTPPVNAQSLTTYTYTVSDGTVLVKDTISIIVNAALVFPSLPITDRNYSPGNQTFIIQLPKASGGTGEITYTLTPPLPDGSTFDAEEGTIMVTPTAEQTKQYIYTAKDTNGALATQIFAINISATRSILNIVKYDYETIPGLLAGTGTAFGSSVANLGDIDENGTNDLAVGAPLDDSGGSNRGAVYILFMNEDNKIDNSTKIIHGSAGIELIDDSNFGTSVANIGDFNGDGINELAVGTLKGEIYILRLNDSGEIERFSKIDVDDVNDPIQVTNSIAEFGNSIAKLGDIDGDGINDLAVGSIRDGSGGLNRGAVHILFMDETGLTLKANAKIRHPDVTLADYDAFGSSIAKLGDLDGDGINDLAVGAIGTDKSSANTNEGAVHILLLNRDGSIKSDSFKIVDTDNDNIFNPGNQDFTGASIAKLGDINGDGINDIAVGAPGNIPSKEGSVFTILMRRAKDNQMTTNGFFRIDTNSHPDLNLSPGDKFGASIANIGDRNGDRINDLAVGAPSDDSGGTDSGALYILYMDANTNIVKITSSEANGSYNTGRTIHIQVMFSEAVDVTGKPKLSLETGSTDTQASYISGSGSDTLIFRYTIVAGDEATDLDYKRTASLTLNGGTINATAAPKYRALLTLPEPGTRGSLSSNKNISINTDAITNRAPTQDHTIPTQELTVNTPFIVTIPAGTFIDADNDPLEYFPFTELPDGITLDADTGTFSGTPVTEQTLTEYDYFVSDGTVSIASMISIIVNAAPTLSTIADINYSPDSLISETLPLVIEGTGTKPIKYTLSPTRVDGLITFDAGTRMITGTAPTAEQTRQYTYTAEDKNGALAAQTFTLSIKALELPNISDKIYSLGNTINEILPAATGGTGALTYTVTPELADGLTFSTATRTISGTPERLSRSEYTYTAEDSAGTSVSINFFIAIITEAISPFPAKENGRISDIIKYDRVTFPGIPIGAEFGSSVADLGDIDGNGTDDLAVGAPSDDSGGRNRGAVYILLMNADNTVKPNPARITHSDDPAGIQLPFGARFGTSVANIGDFDGNGINELAIGTRDRGIIYIVHLTRSGELDRFSTLDFNDINTMLGNTDLITADRFGASIANLGDIDGDGVIDLAVGAPRGDGGNKGAVYILFMDDETGDPTLKDVVKFDVRNANLNNNDFFGSSVANLGDLNQDGINDLAVGATNDDAQANNAGTVHIFYLNRDGSVKPGGFEIFDRAFNPNSTETLQADQ